jgi:hypothetical protein
MNQSWTDKIPGAAVLCNLGVQLVCDLDEPGVASERVFSDERERDIQGGSPRATLEVEDLAIQG